MKSYILLMTAGIYAILAFVLYAVTMGGLTGNVMGEPVPLSVEAFISPLMSVIGMALVFITIVDLILYHKQILPSALSDPRNHLIALVFPEVIAVFGFVLGFLEMNFWVALPFFALGFANTLYAYSRISENQA